MDVTFLGEVIKAEASLDNSKNRYTFKLFLKASGKLEGTKELPISIPNGEIQLEDTRVFNYGDKVPIRFYNIADGKELEFFVKAITSEYIEIISSFVESGKNGHRLVITTDKDLTNSMAKIVGPIRNHFNIEILD